jgi:hypothetical protein
LLFGIAPRAADEEIGDAPEHLDPARVGAGGQAASSSSISGSVAVAIMRRTPPVGAPMTIPQ